jgi:trehalose 6-phosphate synthase/phosphatase
VIDINNSIVKINNITSLLQKEARLVLFLDYDGTLVKICNHPHEAKPTKKVLDILSKLNDIDQVDTYIISGRGFDDLLSFFDKKRFRNISWVASHGAEVKIKGNKKKILDKAKKSIDTISLIRKEIEMTLEGKNCYFIEDKSVSFSIHYRNCNKEDQGMLKEIKKMIKSYENIYDIDSLEMKKVVEVKCSGINKGVAVESILEDYGSNAILPIAIGDDVTDEYTFEANKDGINIKVSEEKDLETKADYYIEGPGKVLDMLEEIIKEYSE